MKPKTRGNGQGTAYQRPGEKTWTVEVVVGWRFPDGDPSRPKRPVRKKKGGFKTKKLALDYVSSLQKQSGKRVQKTLEEVWLSWKAFYESRVVKSTMDNYLYAYMHFNPLHGIFMDRITANDLQSCMDHCKSGKRTHENMRCVANLLWKYAIDQNIIDRNVASNLYIGDGVSVQREPIDPEEEAVIKSAIGRIRYAEYVYCLCWLGYRPGEMLQLRKDQIFCAPIKTDSGLIHVWYFVNGKKTDAGRDRIVIVPDEILPYVIARLYIPGTDLVFPQYVFNRKKTPSLVCFKEMSHAYFRTEIFKPMMKKLNIAEGKVPYSGRHAYADKLKNAKGTEKDKAQLIGHSSYLTTVNKYQSSHLEDLHALVNSFSTPTVLPPKNPQHIDK